MVDCNQIVALIPARSGSKAVPQKNIRLLGGHPLIAYCIAAAKLTSQIGRVFVTTDSQEIADIALKYGAEAPFLRPAGISQDHSTDREFFEHFVSYCRENEAKVPEYMVHLRPSTPLRDVVEVEKALAKILNDDKATALRSAHEIPITAYKIFQIENNYLKDLFPGDLRDEYYNLPRQAFPKNYYPNGYVDVVRASVLEQGRLHGDKILAHITGRIPDIDCEEDLTFAEEVLMQDRFVRLRKYLDAI